LDREHESADPIRTVLLAPPKTMETGNVFIVAGIIDREPSAEIVSGPAPAIFLPK